jgi:predicted dinucleotide-binding enzyme
MNIAIVGSGMIGGTLARICSRAGHEVVIANRRGPGSLHDLVAEYPAIRAVSVQDALATGDLSVLAVPFGVVTALPHVVPSGHVVVDATNYYAQRDGRIPSLEKRLDTSSEIVARHLPGARVVKAFNTIYFRDLATQGRDAPRAGRRAIFIAGDDADAKVRVTQLIESIGFGAVDTGPLREGGRQQQLGSELFNVQLSVAAAEAALRAV